MLSEEQVEQIKKQLIEQVEKNFPEDKKELATEQINSMNSEELENFLKQNNFEISNEKQRCIFCSIVQGEIPSYKLDEDENSVAVLEINPISDAHLLVIPKQHCSSEDEISEETFSFAKNLLKKIKSKFKPKKIEIIPSNLFGHEILNLLPIYDDEKISSPRKKASENELKKVLEKFKETLKTPKTKSKKEKKADEKTEKNQEGEKSEIEMISEIGKIPWFPLRIP